MTVSHLAEMTQRITELRRAATLYGKLPWWTCRRWLRRQTAQTLYDLAAEIETWAATVRQAQRAERAIEEVLENEREEARLAERRAQWRQRAEVLSMRRPAPDPLDPRPAPDR